MEEPKPKADDPVKEPEAQPNQTPPQAPESPDSQDKPKSARKGSKSPIRVIDENGEFKDELLSDSSYRTASEFIPDFQSDNEPPTDKLAEERMLIKTNSLRVYKKILKIGTGHYMPAKYDKIEFRCKELPEDSINMHLLDDVAWSSGQLGIDFLDEEIVLSLSNMKANEVSMFRTEHVGMNEEKKRVLQGARHFLVEVRTWDTIIDLHGDMSCMKKVIKRGSGQKRFNVLDEITFHSKVYQSPDHLLREYKAADQLVTSLVPNIPSLLLEVLLSTKAHESLITTMKWEHVEQYETNEDFKKELVPDQPLIIEVEVDRISEVMDLFNDGTALKKVLKNSYTTTAPDDSSVIYFDYKIYDKSNNLITSSKHWISNSSL